MHRLRRRNAGVSISHLRIGDRPSLNHHLRFHPKKSRPPQTQIRQLPLFNRTNILTNSMSNRRINCVFSNVPLRPKIIIISLCGTGILPVQNPSLHLHFMSTLPSPNNDFPNSSHCLGVRRNHAKST